MEYHGAIVVAQAAPLAAAFAPAFAQESASASTAVPRRVVAPSLAPGFRFHPTDEELVRYYLRRQIIGKPFRFQAVTEIDVYKSEPWELPAFSALKSRDMEWYFFSPVDKKYGNGSRLNRATEMGYWKATGKDRPVRHKSQIIGMKKTLVFHSGRAPDGRRTNWVMHEYRLQDEELRQAGVVLDAFVLCRIFQKSGLGPPNGHRYAPFIEEEWEDDAEVLVPGGEAEDDAANGVEARAEGNAANEAEARVEGNGLHQVPPQEPPRQRENWPQPQSVYPPPQPQRQNPPQPQSVYPPPQPQRHNPPQPQSVYPPPQPQRVSPPEPQSQSPPEPQSQGLPEPQSLPFVCKRERTEDLPVLTLAQGKRPRPEDPSPSQAPNGSEESTTTRQVPPTAVATTTSSLTPLPLIEFPLLESGELREGQPSSVTIFDSSNLEKFVPPGYLKFIGDLEKGFLSVSMERETMKLEVRKAQALINILQSRIDQLVKENEELRRLVPGG